MGVTTGTMMAISTGLSVVGSLAKGVADRRAADVEARQSEHLAAQQQDQALQEAERIRRAGKRTQGAARAQLAASGIRVDDGTALVIDEEIGGESEKDAFNTLLTGKRQADASRASASMARARGRNAMTSSVLGSISTGVQGWKGVKAAAPASRKGHDTFAEGEY
jgi:hypothetical protein